MRLAALTALCAVAIAPPVSADMTSNATCWIEVPGNSTYDLAALCGGGAGLSSGGRVSAAGSGEGRFNPDAFLQQYTAVVQNSAQYSLIEEALSTNTWDPLEDAGLYCFAKAFGTPRDVFLQSTTDYAQTELNLSRPEATAWIDHWTAIASIADQSICPGTLEDL